MVVVEMVGLTAGQVLVDRVAPGTERQEIRDYVFARTDGQKLFPGFLEVSGELQFGFSEVL